MNNILLIYTGFHASHRVASAAVKQYKNNYGNCKSMFNLYYYCVNGRQKQQLRIDRFLNKYKINIIYVHSEQEQALYLALDEVGYDKNNLTFVTFTRNDFILQDNYDYRDPRSYHTKVKYTLINELINCEKSKHGMIKIYYAGQNLNVEERNIFSVDLSRYLNYSGTRYFDTFEKALEFSKKEKIEELEKKVRYLEDSIINMANKLREDKIELEKLLGMK